MINEIDYKNIGGYSFKNGFFILKPHQGLKKIDDLQVLKITMRAVYIAIHGIRLKLIVNPRKQLIPDHHVVRKFMPGYKISKADPSLALSHHFRTSCDTTWPGLFKCSKQTVSDQTTLKYETKLLEAFRLRYANLNNVCQL